MLQSARFFQPFRGEGLFVMDNPDLKEKTWLPLKRISFHPNQAGVKTITEFGHIDDRGN